MTPKNPPKGYESQHKLINAVEKKPLEGEALYHISSTCRAAFARVARDMLSILDPE